MPNAWRWSRQRARTFTNHASGGSTTRFGIFSLVYGVHGTYWPAFYAERTPPVLVTELARLSYDMRVISSPRMTFPEFRSTAWVTIPDRVKDAWDGAHSWQRDLSARDDFAAWLDERAGRGAREPFFGFMLLYAPHQTYDWPREQSPYQPYLDKLDYMKMASRPPQDLIDAAHNSWRNAVHFDDGVFGRILHELARHGLESSTLVVLTGDHGEEFFEHGFFGHTSNYTRTQVEVTFAMAGPGVPPGIETRPTSHVDLPVTILELLGADPSGRADWALGENLLAPLEHRDRIVAGWQHVGVWVDEGVLYVPLEGHKGSVNALDWDWKPHPDAAAVEKRHAGAVRELALASRRFVR
jgi:membrane-anchored protein YejM (alkaline phosphatase superfamily)